MKKIVILIVCIILAGCTLTSSLKKKKTRANISLPIRNVSEEQETSKAKAPVLEFKNLKGETTTYATTELDSAGNKRISVELQGVTVVAKSKLVPERNGKIFLDFIVKVPSELISRKWVISIEPFLKKEIGVGDRLHKIVINGKSFKDYQKKGADLYGLLHDRFSYFGRDTTRVCDYYTYKYNLFIKNPSAKLDTIINKSSYFEYYYSQEIEAEDNSKRLALTLGGKVFALDKSTYQLPLSDTITYMVSSMMHFLDNTPHYKRKIIERKAKESMKALISFASGKTSIDETLGQNLNEIKKVENIFSKISSNEEMILDSISLTAGSSPEGSYKINMSLSKLRSNSIKTYLQKKIKIVGVDTLFKAHARGEDWQSLSTLVASANSLHRKQEVLEIIATKQNPDIKEALIAKNFPIAYEAIRKEIYPQLRAVDFTFCLHRKGMLKDTIHTTEIDSLYMAALDLMQNRKYSKALNILNEYSDWNTGICLMSLGYDDAAYNIFLTQKKSADTEYLLAILAARLGRASEAFERYSHSVEMDPSKKWRGSLDPEIFKLVEKYKIKK